MKANELELGQLFVVPGFADPESLTRVCLEPAVGSPGVVTFGWPNNIKFWGWMGGLVDVELLAQFDNAAWSHGFQFGDAHALHELPGGSAGTEMMYRACPAWLRSYFDCFKYGAQYHWRRTGQLQQPNGR